MKRICCFVLIILLLTLIGFSPAERHQVKAAISHGAIAYIRLPRAGQRTRRESSRSNAACRHELQKRLHVGLGADSRHGEQSPARRRDA